VELPRTKPCVYNKAKACNKTERRIATAEGQEVAATALAIRIKLRALLPFPLGPLQSRRGTRAQRSLLESKMFGGVEFDTEVFSLSGGILRG
jgi:hypothetical protein